MDDVNPTTVWMVHLRDGVEPKEDKGRLSLDDEALVFLSERTLNVDRFPYVDIRKAKRQRGSPILMLSWQEEGERRSTAFYFAQPPPLTPPDATQVMLGSDRSVTPFAMARRTSKRRHRRVSARYLTAVSGSTKGEIDAWVQELRSRIARQA
jgi:hypothetical protein